jgi:cytochrome c oxidase cbb3-type subunit I/II
MTDATIERALALGVKGSAMPSWGELGSGDLSAAGAYVAGFESDDRLAEDDRLASADVLFEAGHRVYQTHCTRCHGETGESDGPDAAKRDPRPVRFRDMRPSFRAAAKAIRYGVAGTAMDAWPLLTDGEIQAVTVYLRSFYRGPVRQ